MARSRIYGEDKILEVIGDEITPVATPEPLRLFGTKDFYSSQKIEDIFLGGSEETFQNVENNMKNIMDVQNSTSAAAK